MFRFLLVVVLLSVPPTYKLVWISSESGKQVRETKCIYRSQEQAEEDRKIEDALAFPKEFVEIRKCQ